MVRDCGTIGTVDGYADSSTALDALTTLKNSGGIGAAQHKKIVEDNLRVFYGLNWSPQSRL